MQVASSLINIAALLGVFLTLFALISVLERKILGASKSLRTESRRAVRTFSTGG